MADQKITGLTELSVPDLLDVLEIVDVSDATDDAAGSSRRVQIQRLLANVLPKAAEGRLTLTTGVPVTTSDVTTAGTLYYTPYLGNRLAGYDGTRWQLDAFTEQSLALTVTSGKLYDVFKITGGGLELSAAWTNDTTRADAITTQDGVPVKNGATTRRHLGTIRASGANVTEDSGGGTSSQVGGKRFVWNRYNQVDRELAVIDTTDSWSYTTDTWRVANGATAPSNAVEYITGDASLLVEASVLALVNIQSNAAKAAKVGVGVDSATTPSGLRQGSFNSSATISFDAPIAARYRGRPGLGYHYLAWLEKGADTTSTFVGDAGNDGRQMGLLAVLKA